MEIEAATVFQSLGEEIRLRILALLLDEELCVCDLVAVLQLPQSTVSRHLAHLKKCGWIRDRRVGVWIYYSLAPDLPPLQDALLPVLRSVLGGSGAAGADQMRLRDLGKGCCCA